MIFVIIHSKDAISTCLDMHLFYLIDTFELVQKFKSSKVKFLSQVDKFGPILACIWQFSKTSNEKTYHVEVLIDWI